MESNAGEEGIHFQSYPFDFLEFLNHQRFEPLELYNHHDHAKAVTAIPGPSTQYDYCSQTQSNHTQFPCSSKLKEFKVEIPSSSNTSSVSKKSEPTTTQQFNNQLTFPNTQTIFDGTFNASQWGIVDLSSHQHLFSNLKRNVPGGQQQPAEAEVKDDKNYYCRLKYLIDHRFPCTICQKSFKQSSHLVQHMLVHTGERPYECNICGRTYNHISSLIRHKRCHKEETGIEAANSLSSPDRETAAAAAVVAAAMTETTVEPSEVSVTNREQSIAIQQDGPFTCSLCWKVFKKQSHLQQHQIIHTGEKPFSCSVCDKSFNRRESLKRHVKTHSDSIKVQCEVCGKAFRDNSYLLKHQATHTGERPNYKCDLCGKTYAAPQSLLRHKQVHEHGIPQQSVDQPVKEPVAPVTFQSTSVLPTDVAQSGPATISVNEKNGSAFDPTSVKAQLSLPNSPSKTFCCAVCGRGFGRRETLKRHERIHTGEKPHQCAVCGKRFRESFHLTKHHVVHTRERPYRCELCRKVFGYPQSLTRHKQIHRIQMPCMVPTSSLPADRLTFGCTDCGERFPDSFQLMNHKELHMSEKPYVCDTCGKCFGFIENLMWHKLVHQTAQERLLPVGQCQETTRNQQVNCMDNCLPNDMVSGSVVATAGVLTSTFEEHPMIHSVERFSCSICGQSFKHFLALVTHKYVHLVRRTLACNVCGQNFGGAYDLLLHRRTHLQKRHFTCSVCGKRFWEAALLMRHQRCHTEERPYRCTVCGRGFLHSWYLRQHKVVHTGERAYKCALCNKRFAQSSSLAEHQRLHVVARPQCCQTCGKTFRYRSNLLEHQRVHFGEKVYRCDQCGKSFFYISSILRHQRSHNAKPELRCSCCEKLFKDPKYFSKHVQTHQGGRPFKCGACGEAFSNTYGLKKHRHAHKMEKLAAATALVEK
ncbi:zinc finger 865 [Pelobates cultripes]|uniref:Zinc finger protein 865 n=1 Tax=Pelobates cultripes TaxID=61616 RepID=A0AAD1TA68_PELCU|nr:zinc finger 865 [Pelobates cultripes]